MGTFRHDRPGTIDTVSVQGLEAPAVSRTAIAPDRQNAKTRICYPLYKAIVWSFRDCEIPHASIVWFQVYSKVMRIPPGAA